MRMRCILSVSLFLFLLFPISAQSVSVDQEDILKPTDIEGDPSMLYTLEGLREFYPEMTDEQKAEFGLRYAQALQLNEQLNDLTYLDFSIDYFSQINQKKKLARSWLYKGRYYKGIRDYPNAIHAFLIAKDQLNPKKDFNLLGNIYFELAHLSTYQDQFTKGLDYVDIAINYFQKADNKENISGMYVLKAWIYQTTGDLDSSIVASKYVLDLATDSTHQGDALNDIGYSYYQKGMLDSANYYIKQSMHYPSYSKNGAIRYFHQAQVFTDLYEYDSAGVYLAKALYSPIDIYTENDCYKLLMRISLMSGNTKNLGYYITKQQACADSIRKIEMQPNINTLEQLYKTTKETEEAQYRNTLLVVFIGIIIILAIPILLFLLKQKKQEKVKADNYKIELERKHEVLLKELANDFEKTRAKYAEKRKRTDFSERYLIDKEIYNEVLYFDDQEKFIDKMNTVLNHLPDKLRTDYPNISVKEISWCCLFLLEIPTQDIAMLLGYTQSSLYKFKQRLAKKLNFSKSKELEEMLHEKVGISE